MITAKDAVVWVSNHTNELMVRDPRMGRARIRRGSAGQGDSGVDPDRGGVLGVERPDHDEARVRADAGNRHRSRHAGHPRRRRW